MFLYNERPHITAVVILLNESYEQGNNNKHADVAANAKI